MLDIKEAPARARGQKNIVRSKAYPQSASRSKKFNLSTAERLSQEIVYILIGLQNPHLEQWERLQALSLFRTSLRRYLSLGRRGGHEVR